MGSHRKGQSYIHAARVALHRSIDEFLNARKFDNFIELAHDFRAPHPENRTVEKNVIPASQLRVEACPDFKQTSYAAAEFYPARGGTSDPREELEQGRLAGAVVADQPYDFARLNFER